MEKLKALRSFKIEKNEKNQLKSVGSETRMNGSYDYGNRSHRYPVPVPFKIRMLQELSSGLCKRQIMQNAKSERKPMQITDTWSAKPLSAF